MTVGVRRRVRDQETAWRFRVVLAIGLLIVLGMSPIFAHHLGVGLDQALSATDHWGALCLVALHYLMDPVHSLFHGLLLGGILYAVWDRTRAGVAFRRAMRSVAFSSPRPGSEFVAAAERAGIDPGLLRIGGGLPIPAFTSGLLRPRIHVEATLARTLSKDELAAVLAHEAAHVEFRDPLRLASLRFLSLILFWLPGFRRLVIDLAVESEIRADDHAAALGPTALASSLIALAEWPYPTVSGNGITPFHHPDLLARRVRRLLGQDVGPQRRISRRFVLAAFTVLLLVWTSGVAVAHPLPVGAASHCDHGDSMPWAHLVCPNARVPVRAHCVVLDVQ